MDEYWATRTGRWRRAVQKSTAPSLGERLYAVIRADLDAGQLPAGAVLPTSERVAADLAIAVSEVQASYARLLAEGVLEEQPNGALCIAGHGTSAGVGDATQIRFEAALLKAVREAAARGLSASEATGMFKAALIRMDVVDRQKKKRDD